MYLRFLLISILLQSLINSQDLQSLFYSQKWSDSAFKYYYNIYNSDTINNTEIINRVFEGNTLLHLKRIDFSRKIKEFNDSLKSHNLSEDTINTEFVLENIFQDEDSIVLSREKFKIYLIKYSVFYKTSRFFNTPSCKFKPDVKLKYYEDILSSEINRAEKYLVPLDYFHGCFGYYNDDYVFFNVFYFNNTQEFSNVYKMRRNLESMIDLINYELIHHKENSQIAMNINQLLDSISILCSDFTQKYLDISDSVILLTPSLKKDFENIYRKVLYCLNIAKYYKSECGKYLKLFENYSDSINENILILAQIYKINFNINYEPASTYNKINYLNDWLKRTGLEKVLKYEDISVNSNGSYQISFSTVADHSDDWRKFTSEYSELSLNRFDEDLFYKIILLFELDPQFLEIHINGSLFGLMIKFDELKNDVGTFFIGDLKSAGDDIEISKDDIKRIIQKTLKPQVTSLDLKKTKLERLIYNGIVNYYRNKSANINVIPIMAKRNQIVCSVCNLRNEVLKNSSYWEKLLIRITIVELENSFEFVCSIEGWWGTGINNPPELYENSMDVQYLPQLQLYVGEFLNNVLNFVEEYKN